MDYVTKLEMEWTRLCAVLSLLEEREYLADYKERERELLKRLGKIEERINKHQHQNA